jgi:hypothetical protein
MNDNERRTIMGGVMVRRPVSLTGRMILGLVIVTLGVLWTLDNLGILDSGPILRWWPIVLVVFGAAKLLGLGTRRHLTWGTMFVLAGLWMLAGSLDIVGVRPWHLWPLVLVVIGVNMLMRSGRRPEPSPTDEPSSHVDTFAMWSGVVRKALSQQFRGGEVTAVMGGAEIDLRGASTVQAGAVLDLFVWWGGVELTVNESWRVINEATVVMGAIEDKSRMPAADARNTLILRGLVIMGGIEIKS